MSTTLSRVIIEHDSLTFMMNTAGYKVNDAGQCHGVAYTGGKAFVCDESTDTKNKNVTTFFNRLRLLNEKGEHFFKSLNTSLVSSDAKANAQRIDILSFFDSVASLQCPENYRDVFPGDQALQIKNPAAPYVLEGTTLNSQTVSELDLNYYYTNPLSTKDPIELRKLLVDKTAHLSTDSTSSQALSLHLDFAPTTKGDKKPWYFLYSTPSLPLENITKDLDGVKDVNLNDLHSSALSRYELAKHIDLLSDKLEVRTSIMLGSHNHAICICYDPKSDNADKPWHLIDANHLTDSTFSSSEIAKMLPNSLIMDDKDELIIFSSQYCCSKANQEKLKQNVSEIIHHNDYKRTHAVTPAKASNISKDKVFWL